MYFTMVEFITGFTKERSHQTSIVHVARNVDCISELVSKVLIIKESPSHFYKRAISSIKYTILLGPRLMFDLFLLAILHKAFIDEFFTSITSNSHTRDILFNSDSL